MERIQPVINWFTDRGGKVVKRSTASTFDSIVKISNEGVNEVSDHCAEIGVCSISDELFNYMSNDGPYPEAWAKLDRENEEECEESNYTDSPDSGNDEALPDEIGRSSLTEITYRGLQIFLGEVFFEDDSSTVSIQFLLDHGRNDNDESIKKALAELEPLLPEKAEFDVGCSIGTDVFLVRSLSKENLEPTILNETLTTLFKFAEFAVTKLSILFTIPEISLKAVGLII